MKPPEEIKKGLACLSITDFMKQYEAAKSIAYTCVSDVVKDAHAYIQRLESDNAAKQKRIEELESRLAQVERERDAALKEWKRTKMDSEGMCWTCKYGKITGIGSCRCVSPFPCDEGEEWQWRGVCAENTEEDDNAKVD